MIFVSQCLQLSFNKDKITLNGKMNLNASMLLSWFFTSNSCQQLFNIAS